MSKSKHPIVLGIEMLHDGFLRLNAAILIVEIEACNRVRWVPPSECPPPTLKAAVLSVKIRASHRVLSQKSTKNQSM